MFKDDYPNILCSRNATRWSRTAKTGTQLLDSSDDALGQVQTSQLVLRPLHISQLPDQHDWKEHGIGGRKCSGPFVGLRGSRNR